MTSIRHLINLVEAPRMSKAKPKPIDTAALKVKVGDLAGVLARHPFDIEWDQAWVRMVMEMVRDRKADHDASNARHGENEPFNTGEMIADTVATFYERASNVFSGVRRDVEYHVDEYQDRKSDPEDHPDNYIEASDFLTAMDAQTQAAQRLQSMTMDPAGITAALPFVERFITAWNEAMTSDQHEEPLMTSDMLDGLSKVFPLILLTLKD